MHREGSGAWHVSTLAPPPLPPDALSPSRDYRLSPWGAVHSSKGASVCELFTSRYYLYRVSVGYSKQDGSRPAEHTGFVRPLKYCQYSH